jgi:hypothetical protein
VGLAFNDNLLLPISKIKVVQLLPIDADFNCYARYQIQSLLSEENLSLRLKITTNLSIAFSPFALEWFIHLSSLQQRRHGVCLLNRRV